VTPPAFDELLRRLVDADVRFVLVGGLAVNAWGVVRGTKDVDVVPDPAADNIRRLAQVAAALGGHVQTAQMLASSASSIEMLLSAGDQVVIATPLGPLDVVQGLDGVPEYERLREHATVVDLLGVSVPVCSLRDLRAMKRAAARTRDLADLEDLDLLDD
jgi:hypothetical protein